VASASAGPRHTWARRADGAVPWASCGERVSRGTAQSTSAAMRPEASAAAIHRLRQPPNLGPVSMASAMPVGMKQLHSAMARLRSAACTWRASTVGPATVMSTKPSPSTAREASSTA